MTRIRIAGVVFFLAVTVIFVAYRMSDRVQTDSTPPVIVMTEDTIEVSCTADDSELLAGITATDNLDGDVTSSLTIESMSSFIETGRRTVTIAAFDSDNNVRRVTREVIYTDYESPVFSLSQPLRFAAGSDSSDILSALTVTDLLDGDLSDKLKVTGNDTISLSTVGDYSVTFSVTNSAGDLTELPVTVTIYNSSEEASAPAITLSDYLIYVDTGSKIDPWDYVQQVTLNYQTYIRDEDGVLYAGSSSDEDRQQLTSDSLSMEGTTSFEESGVYEICYSITDSDERTGTVNLIVVAH